MTPRFFLAFLLLFFCSAGGAQTELVPVIKPKARTTNRIIFVIDASGSMEGDPLASGIGWLHQISEQPTDDLRIGVVVFQGEPKRFVFSAKDSHGWLELPNPKQLEATSRKISSKGAGGQTNVVPALQMALQDPEEDLTVILITDGVFNEQDKEVRVALAAAQKKRKTPAVVGCIGTGHHRQILKDIGKAGKGGYYAQAEPSYGNAPPDPAVYPLKHIPCPFLKCPYKREECPYLHQD